MNFKSERSTENKKVQKKKHLNGKVKSSRRLWVFKPIYKHIFKKFQVNLSPRIPASEV